MLPYVAQIKSGLRPLLICATYGSIQSLRKPDTAHIQCPPEDERCETLETCRGARYDTIVE
jgi:hypothetical protein